MDVHGTKLVRTLFTIATEVERGAAQQRDGADRQKRPALCEEKSKVRAAFACSSSQAFGMKTAIHILLLVLAGCASSGISSVTYRGEEILWRLIRRSWSWQTFRQGGMRGAIARMNLGNVSRTQAMKLRRILMKPNKRIEFAPFGRPTRKQLRCLVAARSQR
jgi:hypothetical protein